MAELQESIDAAKAQGHKVYKAVFDDGVATYYIRPIQRLEYKRVIEVLKDIKDPAVGNDLHDEKVVTTALVFPEATADFLSTSGAGVVTFLSNEILKVSGFAQNIVTTEV